MPNNSKVGGVLTIVSSSIGILCLIFTVFSILVTTNLSDYYHNYSGSMTYVEYQSFYHILVTFMLIFGVIFCSLALIGGIFALKKKLWGLALAGSIAALFIFFPCGIPAIIFVAMGNSEFKQKLKETNTAELVTPSPQ